MAKIIPNDEKVFMVSKSTNTIYSGSAALKAMNEWYTMEDVVNTVRPYKVYTALLTQAGGDNNEVQNSGAVTKGVTYLILGSDGDFSNVGAPTNNNGQSFIATSAATPNSYGTGQLIFNTGAVISNTLQNTIGNLYWSYNGNGGAALLSSDNGFIEYKTSIIVATPMTNFGQVNGSAGGSRASNGAVILQYIGLNSIPASDLLLNTLIEVRVYN